MNSGYAYVQYTKTIETEAVTANGEIVLRNWPSFAGQLDLVSVRDYESLKSDFPDCIKGGVIKQDNLLDMINYCYGRLKEEASELREYDSDVNRRLSYLESQFEVDGVLEPDSTSESDIRDLANKYFLFQLDVRQAQASRPKTSKHM